MTLKAIDIPIELDPDEVTRILRDAGGEPDPGKRIDLISERFLGRPYVEGPLGGGPALREELRVSLKAFDCVTYIEAVLALSFAHTIDDYIETIRRVRYKDGDITWLRRNHYMADWASNNEEIGLIRNMTSGPETAEKTCTLAVIAGLRPKTITFRYFLTQTLGVAGDAIEDGDLILFVSTRQTLDVFHTGILVRRPSGLMMRHATRTAGAVIEQGLENFINQNKMAGFVLLRPLCRR